MFNSRIVPGVDEADIDGTFGTGFLHTKRESIAKSQFFRDGEGGHVAQFVVAINFSAGTSQHAGKVFDIFHGAHQVAKVGTIEFVAGNMDKVFVREFAGNGFGGIHEAEGGCDYHVKAFSG